MNGELSRLSLNTATCRQLSLRACIDVATEAGLGGIGPWRDRVNEVGLKLAATMLADSGLSVTTLCRGGFLTATDVQGQQAASDDNRRALDEAAAIGARELVLVVGGLPASNAAMGLGAASADCRDIDVQAARERVVDRVADLVPEARDRGVRLALEPMHPLFAADRGVLSTLDQALAMAAPFTASDVGIVVDSYHVWWDPRLHSALMEVGEQGRLASYQVSDWTLPLAATALNSRGFPGDGFIDFPTLTQWISEAGYSGLVEMEIFNEDVWAQPGHHTVATMAERYRCLVLPFLS